MAQMEQVDMGGIGGDGGLGGDDHVVEDIAGSTGGGLQITEVPEMETGGGEEAEPSEQQPGESRSDWLERLDPEDRRFAESKGYADDPTRAIKSAREAEQNMHRMQQQMDRLLAQPAPQPQNQQPNQQPSFFQGLMSEIAPVAQAVDSGDIDPGQGMAVALDTFARAWEAREAALLEHVRAERDESLAPVVQRQTGTQFGERVNAMKSVYGDAFEELKTEANQILKGYLEADPSYRTNPRTVDLAFQEAASRQYLASRQRDKPPTTLNGRGTNSAGRPKKSEAQIVMEEIDAAMGMHTGGPLGGGL